MSNFEPSTALTSWPDRIEWFLRQPLLWSSIVTGLFLWFLDRNRRWPDSDQDTWWHWFYDDPMSFTGFLALIVGLGCSVVVDRDQLKLIKYLYDSTIVDMTEETWTKIKIGLRRNSLTCQFILVLVVIILMVIGYFNFFVFSPGFSHYPVEFVGASIVCSIVAGLRLGRLVANSLTGRTIEAAKPSFEVLIAHPDRAGGLARIGTFYFCQTLTLLIPTIWLCIWLSMIHLQFEPIDWKSYVDWWPHFWRLQIGLTVLLAVCFLLPMRSFQRLIISWKKANITRLLSSVQEDLRALQKDHRHDSCKIQQSRQLVSNLHSLTSLPNWPISPRVRAAFGSTMVTLFISIASSWLVE